MNYGKNQEERYHLREKLSEISEIPKDAALGFPILTMLGKKELGLENDCGILEYTEECIHIQTKIGRLIVTGRCLQVDYYINDEIKITGHIQSIEYL